MALALIESPQRGGRRGDRKVIKKKTHWLFQRRGEGGTQFFERFVRKFPKHWFVAPPPLEKSCTLAWLVETLPWCAKNINDWWITLRRFPRCLYIIRKYSFPHTGYRGISCKCGNCGNVLRKMLNSAKQRDVPPKS